MNQGDATCRRCHQGIYKIIPARHYNDHNNCADSNISSMCKLFVKFVKLQSHGWFRGRRAGGQEAACQAPKTATLAPMMPYNTWSGLACGLGRGPRGVGLRVRPRVGLRLFVSLGRGLHSFKSFRSEGIGAAYRRVGCRVGGGWWEWAGSTPMPRERPPRASRGVGPEYDVGPRSMWHRGAHLCPELSTAPPELRILQLPA